MKIIIVLALAAVALAEPPAPRYPSSNYGAPSEVLDYMSPPHQQAPSSEYGAPSSQYGAPSSEYGAPSSQYGAPSSQYGAPSSQTRAPSSQYGAPSSQYGAPSRNGNRKSNAPSVSTQSIRIGSGRKASRPSSKYGAPSAFKPALHTAAIIGGSFGGSQSSISTQYGAPSALNGAARNGGYSHSSQPSSQYGAPQNGGYSYGNPAEDDMSEPASYRFQYEVNDQEEGAEFGHQEEREGEDAKGEYRVLLPDGRTQIVTYTADERGFLPEVRYEEPQGGYGRGPVNSKAGGY